MPTDPPSDLSIGEIQADPDHDLLTLFRRQRTLTNLAFTYRHHPIFTDDRRDRVHRHPTRHSSLPMRGTLRLGVEHEPGLHPRCLWTSHNPPQGSAVAHTTWTRRRDRRLTVTRRRAVPVEPGFF